MDVLELRTPNREAWESWKHLLEVNPSFRESWIRSEWQAYASLLHHSVTRFLGRYVQDGHRPCKVLEIGFGRGAGILYLVEDIQVPESMITGVEILEEHVETARGRWPAARFDLVGADPGDLLSWMAAERDRGGWYDLIVARNVLQYLPEPDRVLAGIAGLLPEGRVLAAVTPGSGESFWPQERLVDVPMAFDDPGVGNIAARRLAKLPVREAVVAEVVGPDRRWRPGWARWLAEAGIPPVEIGTRRSIAERRNRESYAICRRVA